MKNNIEVPLRLRYNIIMKIELESVVDMWEKLKDFDKKSVWNDESVFESVSMDDFVDDVNEMYRLSGGRDGWYMSDFENVNEFGVLSKGGDYVERDCE